MNKAFFLDRDGIINLDTGYIRRIEDIQILNGVPEAIKKIKDKGYLAIVISNQSAIGRDMTTEDIVIKINNEINKRIFESSGVKIDKFYFCPHHPDDNCNCRKPKTGMIDKAVKEFDINLNESFMIGDKLSDIELGRNARTKTVLIGKTEDIKPDYTFEDLKQAVENLI